MFIIYGKDNCSWCESAKVLLEGYYIFKNVQHNQMHFNEFQEEFPGAKTVPKIIEINNSGNTIKRFNSYEELAEYFN